MAFSKQNFGHLGSRYFLHLPFSHLVSFCFFICVHEECLACHFAGQAARRYASDNEQLRAREMLVSSEPLVARASLVAILIRI